MGQWKWYAMYAISWYSCSRGYVATAAQVTPGQVGHYLLR